MVVAMLGGGLVTAVSLCFLPAFHSLSTDCNPCTLVCVQRDTLTTDV